MSELKGEKKVVECEAMDATKPDKIRRLSVEKQNAIDYLLQGKSDRAVAEAVGVSRQTICEWRNNDVLFIAELNRQRSEMWHEARLRMKALANKAIDTLESQLANEDPKVSLAAAKQILQGNQLLGDISPPSNGPTTPEALLMPKLEAEAREELRARLKESDDQGDYLFGKPVSVYVDEAEVKSLAKRKLEKALVEAGL